MNYAYPDTTILVFSKPAIAGKCKTRLIPYLGERGAAKLQSNLLNKILTDLTDFSLCPFEVWQSEASPYFKNLNHTFNNALKLKLQCGDNLGARMSHAITAGLKKSKRVIIVGSDCIEYSKDYLMNAIRVLETQDVVLGPAYDGGYVLIGMTKSYPALFNAVSWGTSLVLDETLQNIEQCQLQHTLLLPLNDIDTAEDYKKTVKNVGHSLHE